MRPMMIRERDGGTTLMMPEYLRKVMLAEATAVIEGIDGDTAVGYLERCEKQGEVIKKYHDAWRKSCR